MIKPPSMTKPLWIALGILSVGAGIAGIVLPLVPTTPFILLAAFAFARSSPKLERWILDHATFGPLIADWRRYGAVPRRAKILALLLLAGALAGTILMQLPLWVLSIQGIVAFGVAAFLISRPEGPRGDPPTSK